MFGLRLLFLTAVITAIGLAPAQAEDWVLYDNFSSGPVNQELWAVQQDNGIVEVIDGRLKVVALPGQKLAHNGLAFAKDPDRIKAVKFTVTMESATGDLRTRLHGWVGQAAGRPLKGAIQSRPNPDRNYHHAWLGEFTDQETWTIDLFWAYFRSPIQIIGQPYTMSMRFDPDDLRWSVDGLGEIQYNNSTGPRVTALTDPTYTKDKFLGTRAYSDEAEGTVYFDDVYVIWK